MRLITRALGLAALCCVLFAAPAQAARPAVGKVTPSTGLVDNELVSVSWKRVFNANRIYECSREQASYTPSPYCNEVGGNADGISSGSQSVIVHTGTVGAGTCGTSASDATCWLVVANWKYMRGGYGYFQHYLNLPITFAISARPTLAPTASVTPSTGLTDAQEVTVSWKRVWNANTIEECGREQKTYTFDTSCSKLVEPRRQSSGSLPVNVFTGFVGTDGSTCGTSSADATCWIVVANLRTHRSWQYFRHPIAQVAITFAAPGGRQ